MSISKVHISNMYIKYTFVHFAILLICKILGEVPLPVTSPFAVEALSFRLGSSFGFLPRSGNFLTILLKLPFFPLPFFLKLVVLLTINTFLHFYLCGLKHCEELGNCFVHPLHIIVHHEAFIAWWQ